MEKTLTDILVEQAQEREKYFQNYLLYAKRIKREAEKLLGKVRVFVFGSILKKDEVSQDIDVLIISPKLKMSIEKSRIMAKLWRVLGFSSPFEIHLINPEEYQDWYRYFIKKKIEIK
jgi:hypothetical protein